MKILNKIFALLSLITIIGISNVDAQCNASLSYIDNGNGNYTFTNTSTGTNYHYWFFGDGGSSTNTVASHTYATNGTYTVSLQVGDSTNGCLDTAYQIITVTSASCVTYANFTYTDNGSGNYSFTNTTAGATSPYYYWDFGDGNNSSTTNPSHTFVANGSYVVCLDVYDTLTNCFNQYCDTVFANSTPCNVVSGFAPQVAQCINSNTFNFSNTGTTGATYSWNFGDSLSLNSNQENPTFVYSYPGTFTVTQIVTLGGCSDTSTNLVTVYPMPTPSFTYNDNGSGNFTFTSTSTGVSDLYNSWYFGDGSSDFSVNSTPVSHTYSSSGSFNVTLIIQDSLTGCLDTAIQTINVSLCNNLNVNFTYTDNGNGNYSFTSNVTGGSVPYSYLWNFGNGNTSTLANPSYTFTNSGYYTPYLVVTDSANCTGNDLDTIYISTCNYNVNDTTYNNWPSNIVQFNTNATGSNFLWDFGNGNTSSLQNPVHTFTTFGTYFYCLTVDSCPPVCDSVTITYQCQPYYIYTNPDSNTVATDFGSYGHAGANYFWDFGDGNTSTLQYPEHTYANSGTYYYCLTIDSCPPVCDTVIIDYCNYSVYQSGSFTSGYNFWTGSNSTNLLWDFGDGNSSAQHSPLHYYANPGTYYYCLTVDSCPPICDSITVIQVTNISGTLYLDNNFNCNLDNAVDVPQIGAAIELWQNGNIYQYTTTNSNGFYSFNVPINQNYTIKVGNYINGQPYSANVGCPASGEYNIFLNSGGSTNNDFGITPTNDFDLTGDLWTWGAFPGSQDWIDLSIYNLGTTPINAMVKLILDPKCSYDSASTWYWGDIPPDTIILEPTGDTLVWNSVTPSSYLWNYANIIYDTTITIGDTVCFTLMEFPLIGDADQSNNVQQLCVPVSNSYDPNIKEVLPAGNGPTGLIQANQKMEYTIHFQNTGTAPANNIYILDVIDSDLDLNSLKILGASHNYSVQLLANNEIQLRFDNINLPDSFSNEPHSHGYIKYSIEQKPNLTPGAEIQNTASIYFDFNAPIVTNTTLNTIDSPTSVETVDNILQDILVYPNPFKKDLTIELNLLEQTSVEIFVTDILGNRIAKLNNSNLNAGKNKLIWEAKKFSNGIYLLNIKTNNSLEVKKLILNR